MSAPDTSADTTDAVTPDLRTDTAEPPDAGAPALLGGGRLGAVWPIVVLALLAYVPALTAAPGRMPADSKLYLYLSPGRFLTDAAGTFDPRQFAGWVPHQHVSFLWPSGPWFWLFDTLGTPDWVAHRLWIGTIMVAAGLGVRWCGRQLGLTAGAALVGAVVYQVGPYLLPYVSRTSVMLLPWAGLGWIVGLTVRATRDRGWRDPALIALVVFTVGAVNATALAMIVPAPVIWLFHATRLRIVTWRQAAVVAGRTAALSAAVSLWWIAALVLQGRHGTDVLPYSESLGDVSLTSTSPEVWRGLGYWLFYLRDPFAATTTESLRYLVSTPAIVVSFAVPIVCLAGAVWVRWPHRRFALLLVAVGAVLAVGVHPVDQRSPLMRLLTGDTEGGLALALRSSTRALPMMQLGLALCAAALAGGVAHLRWRRWWLDRPVAIGICALAIVNQPGMFTGAWVDPALERDADPPAAWIEAAAWLDAEASGRVLMLPGAEFGAYRWGYTVDQPLPGLSERPVVTRDLLPLGSAAAMDLWYAFDDRLQTDTAEPAVTASIGRLFGADTVWLTNDHAVDRFRTARPEVVRDLVLSDDAGDVVGFGDPRVNVPVVPMDDERALGDPRVGTAVAPVELARLGVEAPLVRVYDRTVAVAGNGDGIVDAAAAGVLDATVGLRYVADRDEVTPTDIGQIVTDTNRLRARHWRSSQDTTGFTESGDGGVLDPVESDARLELFADAAPATLDGAFTTAVQRGAVTARASSYGEPFAYLPEHRPFMAVDGDLDTAWLVGEHGDPVGERLELTLSAGSPTGELLLRQPAGDARSISAVEVVERGAGAGDPGARRRVPLDDSSRTGPGQPIPIDPATTVVEITILDVAGGTAGTAGAVAGVGFSEVSVGHPPSTEVVVPPRGLANAPADLPTTWVFTRERSDPMDRWRDDPEPHLVREFELLSARAAVPAYTVRLDARAPDAELAELLGWPAVATSRLTGSIRNAGVAALDGDSTTAWITGFGEAIGATLTIGEVTEPISRIDVEQPRSGTSTITEVELRVGPERRRVALADGVATADVEPPLPSGRLDIVITGIDAATTIDRRFGDTVELPAAINEIGVDGAPEVEPLDRTTLSLDCVPVGEIAGTTVSATLVIEGDAWLDHGAVRATPCDPEVRLPAGTVSLTGIGGVLDLDRVVLDGGLGVATVETATETPPSVIVDDDGRFGGTYTVSGCSAGCVFVYGEGHNDAWSASAAGLDLGPPDIADGGFNGWSLPPSAVPVEIEVAWTAQRPLTVALIASAVFVLFAFGIAVRGGRSSRPRLAPVRVVVDRAPLSRREVLLLAVVWTLAGAALIGLSGALCGAIGGGVAWWTRRRDLPALTALATVIAVGAFVTVNERRWAPFPNGAWPIQFEQVHEIGMFAVAALIGAATVAADDDCRLPLGAHTMSPAPDPEPDGVSDASEPVP